MLYKYYRNYSMFRNIFNLLVVIILICTLTFSFLLYTVFSTITLNNTNKISMEMLSRLDFIVQQKYNEGRSILLSLGNGKNININIMMFNKMHNRLYDFYGYNDMRSFQAVYSNIAYIGVYNDETDEIMCTIGLKDETKERIRHLIVSNYKSKDSRLFSPMRNQMIVLKEYDPNLNTVTLIYYSPLSKEDSIGAIFLAIDCDFLSQLIDKSDNQMTLMTDSTGVVLAHPDKSQILTDYSTKKYLRKVIASGKTSGYFMAFIDNQDTLVTYKRGSSTDWIFVTLTPYAEILNRMNFVRNAVVVISLTIVILGSILSLFFTRRTFYPIANLLAKAGYSPENKKKTNEIEYLNDQFSYYQKNSSIHEALLMNYALESSLKGELSDEKDSVIKQNMPELTAPYYFICLLYIDRSGVYRDLARKEKNFRRFSLAQIADRYLQPLCIGTHQVNIDSNMMALIIKTSTGTIPKGLILALMETQKDFAKEFSMGFSASVSGTCNDIYSLQDCYEEATQLLTERFFKGKNSIIMKRERTITLSNYNQKLENEIWYAIQKNNDSQVCQEINVFIDQLNTLPYDNAKLYITQLTVNLINHYINLKPNDNIDQFTSYKKILECMETIEETHTGLLKLCREIAFFHCSTDEANNHEAIEHALRLTKENYMDKAFSTNVVAQKVGLSIIYFNRIFRKSTGQSYSNYLNNYRLNMACTLLCTTNYSMKHICDAVGIGNESYFYTLFKREYGITPYQYRKKEHSCSEECLES